MSPVLIVLVFTLAPVLGVLSWRWLQVMERIGVERAKAGGDERAREVTDLRKRVAKIEKYASGEDMYENKGS